MAADLLISGGVGAGLGEVLSILSATIKHVITETRLFTSKLTRLQETIDQISPIFSDIEKLNKVLDRPQQETDAFINQLKHAEILVKTCKKIGYLNIKKYPLSLKLDELEKSLLRFFQIQVQSQLARDTKEVLVKVEDIHKTILDQRSTGSWLSRVPLPDGFVIGFDDQVKELKKMVLKDMTVDDCSVVVVSAAGGCGKTTLVKMLCHDPQVKENFGENIYFATISETPNLKTVINDLLQSKQGGQRLDFVNDDAAIQKWGSFLGENEYKTLLVLDDVWSESIIRSFKFKLRGYTILVTSRSTSSQFSTYGLELLNDKDATKLFRHSAFSENRSEQIDDIPESLVDQLVTCCKNHPLTLTVIGGLLKGTNLACWHDMLKTLCEGKKSVLDLGKYILLCLSRSLNAFRENASIKQCFKDLGLFPEDHKIAATMLMDMWVHLYKHHEDGSDTDKQLSELSLRNLATLLPIRKDSTMIANRCEEKFVMQHDLLRTLAIHLSSQEPVEDRERLIVKPESQVPPKVPQYVNARILSISTGENFSVEWNNVQASKVEVLVMNFLSTMHPLPRFIQYIKMLTVLIITNYGYYVSEIENFPPPQYLSSLTRIRLDHVSITSISSLILELKNLQKLSLIMCKIGDSFKECTDGIPNKLPSLLELDIDSCDDLVTFPLMLCNLLLLRKLCITNCHELTSLSEEVGNFPNLEVLRLASCSNLAALPKTIRNLQKLSIIDISDCINLIELPVEVGELRSLQIVYMRGCTGLHELPSLVKGPLEVVCDTETSLHWNDIPNVKLKLVEEDKISNFMKIVSFN